MRHAIASDLAALVNKLMEPTAGGDSGRVSVVADPRTNSVVVRAPSRARASLAKSLIAKLDQPTAEAGNVHVVYLKNADATRLAQTLRAVVSSDASSLPQQQTGTQGGSVGVSGGAVGGQGTQGGQGLGQGNTTAGNTLGGQQTQGAGATSAGYIQADASTNTLIITASDAVYRNMRAVIDLLDARRAQVHIESMIVEVNANKAAEFGVQWLGLTGNSASDYRVGALQSFGSAGANSLTTLAAAGSKAIPGAGFSIGLFKQINGALGLGAIAHALESEGNANILSTPNMLTLDNELATIKVGQNVPIISGQFTTPASGTATNPFQTIDRRDVGITLKVRPQISEGGTIKMAIYQESSSVDPASLKDAAGVTTNIRVIENNVIADDGQIIVLGGLIRDDTGDTNEKVPGLGDLPIIGNLFKYRTRNRNKTNLMVFLRPVIVRSKEDSNAIAADRYDYMRSSGLKAQGTDGTLMVPDYGTPVLPQLTNGQPPPGGTLVAVPPKPRAGVPTQPPAKPAGTPSGQGADVSQQKYRPVQPSAPAQGQ